MPVLIFVLARLGIVTAGWLLKNFKYAVLLIFIFAAVITPDGNPVTQLLVGGPMVVLYLFGIAAAWLFGKSKKSDPDDEQRLTPPVRLTSGVFRLYTLVYENHPPFGVWPNAELACFRLRRMPKTAGPAVTRSPETPGSGLYRRARQCQRADGADAFGLVNEDRSEGFSDITDIGGMFSFGVSRSRRTVRHDQLSPHRRGPRARCAQRTAAGLFDSPGMDHRTRRCVGRRKVQPAIAARVQRRLFGRGARDGEDSHRRAADDGLGTGKADFQGDLITSREFSEKVELTMSTGYRFRGSPDGYNLTQGFKWGIGGAYPSRSRFRVLGEMFGEALVDQEQRFTGSNPAPGMPSEWDPDATRHLFGGFQYNATNGIYFGAGVTYTASYYRHRSDFPTSEDSDFDRLGLQVRIGYYPGCAASLRRPPPCSRPRRPRLPRRPTARPR